VAIALGRHHNQQRVVEHVGAGKTQRAEHIETDRRDPLALADQKQRSGGKRPQTCKGKQHALAQAAAVCKSTENRREYRHQQTRKRIAKPEVEGALGGGDIPAPVLLEEHRKEAGHDGG